MYKCKFEAHNDMTFEHWLAKFKSGTVFDFCEDDIFRCLILLSYSLTFKDIQWAVVLQEGEEIFIFRSYKEEDLHIFPNYHLIIFNDQKKLQK